MVAATEFIYRGGTLEFALCLLYKYIHLDGMGDFVLFLQSIHRMLLYSHELVIL